jgi:MFS family permease
VLPLTILIALFFASLDFSDYQIGLFMTLTLAGDVVLGTVLTLIADKVGRRKILLGGSCLMILSGTVFAVFENFWLLLFAAVIGVISATGGDFGPFRSVEESIMSPLTTSSTRADVLSWYVTLSSLGSALGSETSGRLVHYLQSREGWEIKDAYHAMFSMYTIMGILNFLLVLCLSNNCELQHERLPSQASQVEETEAMLASDSEDDTLEGVEEEAELHATSKPYKTEKPSKLKAALTFFSSRLADISAPTRSTMYKLWFLLALDSVADGMVPYSLTNYYMDEKFHLPKSRLGDITSVSYLLASFSTIFAAPLARRLGLINTMVFTHVPSSTAVLLFPFPNSVILTVGLFFLRAGLNNMDQAPRAAFIAAVVRPEERTAVMGITAMVRTLASTAGPSITGILAGNNRFWIAFVAAGAFRLSYDFGLYAMFISMRLHQHEEEPASKEAPAERRREIDEEEGGEMEMQKL